ncbi:MAG: AtpZ/AtpI family protein [Elusimicrobiota bacterium]
MPDDFSGSSKEKAAKASADTPQKSGLWAYVTSGTELAVSVLLGFFIGYKLDQRLGWSPWLTVVGAGLGVALGLYGFLRPFLKRERKN